MSFDVHVYLHSDDGPKITAISKNVTQILALLNKGATLMTAMDDKLTELTADVAAEGNVINSAVAALNGIQQMITDAVNAALAAGATPEQLQSVSDLAAAVTAQSAALAAAIPATPPPPPTTP